MTRRTATRRSLLVSAAGAVAVAGMSWLAGPVAAREKQDPAPPSDIAFDILRKGDKIGTHKIRFRQNGDTLTVTVDIDIRIKVAFITAYKYIHRNEEVWRNGRLVSLKTVTDDDGKLYRVTGTAAGSSFVTTGTMGRHVFDATTLPSSYWHPRTRQAKVMINTQSGRPLKVSVAPLGSDTVRTADAALSARRYRLTGDMSLELWYAPSRELAKIRFKAEADGSIISYLRVR